MSSNKFGTNSIHQLILEQGVPASVAFLVISLYLIVDTIFIGHWVGHIGIAALTVILPITYLVAAVGIAIGVGGASMISRALGAEKYDYCNQIFAHQIILFVLSSLILIAVGFFFEEEILHLFSAKGAIYAFAQSYFRIVLVGFPFLSWAMLSTYVIRAEGFPKTAMLVLLIPALFNIILDAIFIVTLEMGVAGAAWATSISYILAAIYATHFFMKGKGSLSISIHKIHFHSPIIKEILALGFVSFARQASFSLLHLIVNNQLYLFGSELYVSVYGIASRLITFVMFPLNGLTQGFLPIASWNYGAERLERIKELIYRSLLYGVLVALLIFFVLVFWRKEVTQLFTTHSDLLAITPNVLIYIFLGFPVFIFPLIGSAYFQAIGQAKNALFLTLAKQILFLIPLVFILPIYWGIDGIWYAFPISDFCVTIIACLALRRIMNQLRC